MGTIIWLCITTGIGYWLGLYSFYEGHSAELLGAGIGFVVGLLLSLLSMGGIGEVIGDIDFGGD